MELQFLGEMTGDFLHQKLILAWAGLRGILKWCIMGTELSSFHFVVSTIVAL